MQWPQPSDDFRWVQVGPGPALVCRALEPFADHLFSTRAWALGSGNGDEQAAWTQISRQMGITLASLVRVRQVYGRTCSSGASETFIPVSRARRVRATPQM